MKPLLILISLIILAGADCQFVGQWLLDWQDSRFYNSYACTPESLNISSNTSANGTQGYTVAYTFPVQIWSVCASVNVTQMTMTLNLTQDSVSGVWTDSNGANITYYSSNNTITLTNAFGSPIPLLFDQNGTYLSEEYVYGLILGAWVNPVQVSSSSPNQCCFLSNITFMSSLANFIDVQGTGYLDVNTCEYSKYSQDTLPLRFPDINYAVWNATGNGINATLSSVINATTGELNMLVHYSQDNYTCDYSYQRYGNLISGTWQLDWQSMNSTLSSLPDLVITIEDGFYMDLAIQNGTEVNHTNFYQVQTYYYSGDMTQYVYYTQNEVIIDDNTDILYSRNGSALSANTYIGNWTNGQIISGLDGCCVPEYVEIYNNSSPYNLSFSAYFNSSALSSEICTKTDLEQQDGFVNGTMRISVPSPLALFWNVNDYNLQQADPSIIWIFDNSLNCSYNLFQQKPPQPKSATSISNKFVLFIVGAMLIFITL